jgi:pimeloyl-ACP methyl ester carboxylesterase
MPYASESQFPWLNVIQYPFSTREFDTGDGWMSYVDEGRGRPIVFVHGSPTWSYLYRHFIRDLSKSYRCIAPDLLGFGLSEKPRKIDYRPEAQAKRFADLMEYLDLEDVTLVVQCAGGPVGLSWAMIKPERVRDLVLFNTWLWPLNDNYWASRLAGLVSNPLNRIYYRLLNAAPSFIIPALFGDRDCISRPSRLQYLEPFRNYRERIGLYDMIEHLTKSRRWYERLWNDRAILKDKRALLLWGLKDPIHDKYSLERFEQFFDDSQTHTIERAGRFIPEECPQEALAAMKWFLMTHSPVLSQ